ncbi:MAG: 30S ribosomal protein S6 [bacterium]|nr:30S ribosomal protein S6 [bacterium]
MRTYEALYIVKPDFGDDEIQTIVKETESLVTDNGGSIVRSETWGKRKLAYKVKHCTEGVYVLLRFEAEPTFIVRLEGYFRLSESIIRDLVVYFDEKTLRLEEEQKKRTESEIRANATSRSRDDDGPSGPRRPRRYDDED